MCRYKGMCGEFCASYVWCVGRICMEMVSFGTAWPAQLVNNVEYFSPL